MVDMNDSQIERGKQWLQELLRLARIPSSVTAQETPDSYWLTIDDTKLTPQQIQILIGTDGSVLDSIQYLANAILNITQEPDEQAFYTIELNGYRVQRQEELRSIAEYAAQQVRITGQEYELKSLSSAERRQVHTFLKECEDLETYSQGQEPDRHLIIRKLGD
jgi:spoIIIJ-associated protein